jgi:hypothetical protein
VFRTEETSLHAEAKGVCRMVSSGMLRRVALVRTDVSDELRASFIRVTRIGELGTTLAVTSSRRTPFYRSLGLRFVLWPFRNPRHYLLPPLLSASSILNSILASFLTWYFFAACVGC